MCPPGMSLVAIDARAGEVAANNSTPRYYWDWGRRRAGLQLPQILRRRAAKPFVRARGRARAAGARRPGGDACAPRLARARGADGGRVLVAGRCGCPCTAANHRRARCRSPPSTCAPASMSRRCAALHASVSRSLSPAASARRRGARSVSDTSATSMPQRSSAALRASRPRCWCRASPSAETACGKPSIAWRRADTKWLADRDER